MVANTPSGGVLDDSIADQSLAPQHPACVFEMQKQVQWICRGLYELTEVLVEASSLLVACVYQQDADANII